MVKVDIKLKDPQVGILKDISYKLLKDNFQGLRCIYDNEIDEIILIFHKGNDETFNNYNHIISEISLKICKHCNDVDNIENIFLNIAEFPNKSELMIYISLESYKSSRRNMKEMSNGKISDTDFYMKTDKELIKILEDSKISWESIPSHKKYGQFIRNDLKTLSEYIDTRDIKKYTKFVFPKRER